MVRMSYKVKLNIFEGPLDLLLFLIKRDKIDIYDIPIKKVTEQYLEYLKLMKMLDLEIAGEFLVVAATLIHIKSKMLLPQEEEEEQPEEEDPREELVKQLLEYKKYKDAADRLSMLKKEQRGVFFRQGSGKKEKVVSRDGAEYFEASLFDLITAFQKVLKGVPKETFHKVIKNEFTVSDKIHEIYHILTETPTLFLSELIGKARNKDEVVVLFLAILELIKMREVLAVQEDSFAEVKVMVNPELVKEA